MFFTYEKTLYFVRYELTRLLGGHELPQFETAVNICDSREESGVTSSDLIVS